MTITDNTDGGVITWTYTEYGYKCSEPGDKSGEYVPASEYAALRARCETLEAALKPLANRHDEVRKYDSRASRVLVDMNWLAKCAALLGAPVTSQPETVMPELSEYAQRQIKSAQKPSGLQGLK